MPAVSLSNSFFKHIGGIVRCRPPNSHLNLKFPFKCSYRQIHMENHQSNNLSLDSRGALIVLEGLDRSGKTSQSSGLHSYLEGLGHSVELWRFPNRTTIVGQMITSYLLNKSELDDHTIHLLFSANRWEKRFYLSFSDVCGCVHMGCLCMCVSWKLVVLSFICTRDDKEQRLFWDWNLLLCGVFLHSQSLMEATLRSGTTLIVDRYSYSGVAFSSAKGLDFGWCKAPEKGLLAPDLVVYLDILPEEASKRGGYGGERYEQLEFQKKVAQSYRTLFDASWKIVDATLPMEDIEKQLQNMALDCLMTCRKGKSLELLWS